MSPARKVLGRIPAAYRWALCGVPGPCRHLARARRCRRSDWNKVTAISVNAVTATGAGKLATAGISVVEAKSLDRSSGYRLGSDRGSPNHGSTLASKRVMAQIWSPARVST